MPFVGFWASSQLFLASGPFLCLFLGFGPFWPSGPFLGLLCASGPLPSLFWPRGLFFWAFWTLFQLFLALGAFSQTISGLCVGIVLGLSAIFRLFWQCFFVETISGRVWGALFRAFLTPFALGRSQLRSTACKSCTERICLFQLWIGLKVHDNKKPRMGMRPWPHGH